MARYAFLRSNPHNPPFKVYIEIQKNLNYLLKIYKKVAIDRVFILKIIT